MTTRDWYSEWKGWDQGAFGVPSVDESAYCAAEFGPYVGGGPARIVELGYGNGGVLGWCRDAGHYCLGIESNRSLIEKAQSAGFDAMASIEEAKVKFGGYSFDLAVALDVLEHMNVPEIRNVLKGFRALLKPAGVLVARFPNGDSPFGRAYQYGDSTHQSVLGSDLVEFLALDAGFVVERFKEPAVPLRGAGLMRSSKRLSARALRVGIDALISYAYFSGAIRIFSANLVAVLRATDNSNAGIEGTAVPLGLKA